MEAEQPLPHSCSEGHEDSGRGLWGPRGDSVPGRGQHPGSPPFPPALGGVAPWGEAGRRTGWGGGRKDVRPLHSELLWVPFLHWTQLTLPSSAGRP